MGVYLWQTFGTMITLMTRHATAGTSTHATHTFSLPVNPIGTITGLSFTNPFVSIDNGAATTGSQIVASGASVMNVHGILTSAASTGSGSSRHAGGQITYPF
jgi:hypothetical protein